jgi:hypothetical protein
MIVVGINCEDEENREVSTREAEQLAQKHKGLFLEVSVKKSINVDEAFISLATRYVEDLKKPSSLPKPKTKAFKFSLPKLLNLFETTDKKEKPKPTTKAVTQPTTQSITPSTPPTPKTAEPETPSSNKKETPPSTPTTPPTKDIFLKVSFDKQIGKGNFGVVYSGLWLSEPVALKAILGESSQIQHEIKILQSLNHRNIVRLWGLTKKEEEEKLWMVMEFMPYGNLKTFLEEKEQELGSKELMWM